MVVDERWRRMQYYKQRFKKNKKTTMNVDEFVTFLTDTIYVEQKYLINQTKKELHNEQ